MKMKTKILAVILFCFQMVPAALFANVDLSIGGTCWYTWWKPAWYQAKLYTVDSINENLFYRIEDASNFRTSSNFMGGPTLTLSFSDRWAISSIFTLGRFKFRSGNRNNLANDKDIGLRYIPLSSAMDGSAMLVNYTRNSLKWDSDTTIGYSIIKYIRIFAGLKAQYYKYDESLLYLSPGAAVGLRTLTDTVSSYGPGIGIGFLVPLYQRLYLLINISGILLWSTEDIDIHKTYFWSGNYRIYPVYNSKGKFFAYGGTSSLALSYSIAPINTTISLGGRYQLLKNRQKFGNIFRNDIGMNMFDGEYDHFWGVTFSVIYTFSFKKKAVNS